MRAVGSEVRRFVDVGANTGEWTQMLLEAAPAEIEGLLVDPGLEAQQRLKSRFAERPHVRVVGVALSDTEGSASFYEERDAGTHSSLVPGFARDGHSVREVQVTTLDTIVQERGWKRIDFLKVDAEGYDFRVLKGAQGLLKHQEVGMVQFEYNDAWQLTGTSLQRALELLSSFRYLTYVIKQDGLYELPYRWFGEFYSYTNLVAFPERDLPARAALITGTL